MKNIKLYGFAFWSAQFSAMYPEFANKANEFLGVNPDLATDGRFFQNILEPTAKLGLSITSMCNVDTTGGAVWYNHYDYSQNDCIGAMTTSMPFLFCNTDAEYDAFRIFCKDYHVYPISRDWLEDCKNMNYFTVYHHFEEIAEDILDICNEKSPTADMYKDELHELWLFINDFDCAFMDAVEGEFAGESYTAIHFAELVRVAMRETIFQLFHKHIFMFVDWDQIYIAGSHLNDFSPFLITFAKVLKACSKATMKLSLGSKEYEAHYGRKEE